MPRLQSPATHYDKHTEKKRQQKSKTEMVGNRNTRIAKTPRKCSAMARV